MRRARRRRWIVIGAVRDGWFVVRGSCGFPGGWLMDWRGSVSLFQPMEFVEWRELMGVLDRRLGMAGLRRVSLATGLKTLRWPYRELWVEVERTK